MNDLNFDILGNSANFIKNANEVYGAINTMTSKLVQQEKNVNTLFLRKLVVDVVRVRGEFQQLEGTFATLLKSQEMASTLMSQLTKTAVETPLDLMQVASGAKQLITFGSQIEDVNETLVRLGNIAQGVELPFEQLVSLYGKTMSQGNLSAVELNQFTSFGIPLLQGLADMYGMTTDKVSEMVSIGKIGFPEVQKVIENLTNEGGQFYNLMDKQSGTISGKISNLVDIWNLLLNRIGQSQQGLIDGAFVGVKYLAENYEMLGHIIIDLIGVYGTYRTALLLNSVLEDGFKKAIGARIATTKLAISIQETWNKVLSINPYIAVATIAIAGLSYAFYKVATAETELEKAHERLSVANSDVEKNLTSEVSKLTVLERKLLEAKEGTEEYENIKKNIVDNYSQYYNGLDGEIDRVGNLSTVYSQLVENMRMSIGQRKFESFFNAEQDNLDKTITEKLDTAYKALIDKYGSSKGANLYDQFFDSAMLGEALSPSVIKDLENATFWELKWGGNAQDGIVDFKNNVLNLRAEINKEIKATETVFDEYKSKFHITEEDVSKILFSKGTSANGSLVRENKSLKQVVSEINSAEQNLISLREQSKRGLIEDEIVESAIANLDTLKNSYKLKTGRDYGASDELGSTHKQQKEYESLVEKNKREQARIEVDAQNSVTQSIIDAMDNGAFKTIAQKNLNHKKEIEAIRREAEDKRQALIDKGKAEFEANPAKKQEDFVVADYFNDKVVAGQLKQINEDAAKKIQLKNIQYNRGDDLANLLAEYQDYTQKRLAVEEKFNKDISILNEQRKIAVQNGDTHQVEKLDRAKAQATTEKGKALMGLDYEKLKESPDYIRAFENLKETSSETLNSLLLQLENAKQTAAEVLSPDQLREYTTTIQEIMDELDSRNPFQALFDKKQDLADAEQDLAKAQVELDKARQQAKTVKGGGKVEYTTTKFNEATGKIDTTKLYLTEAQALEQVKNKTNEYNAAKDKTIRAGTKLKKSEAEVKEELDELFKSIGNVGEAIGGSAGEIISLIGDISAFTMTAISGVQAAADTSATAISTVEKASVILAVISAAFQIAMKIASLFNNDEGYQKEIEKLQGRIEQLQWELDNADAIRLQNNSFKALQKVKEVYAETTEEVLKLHTANGKYLNFFERMFLRAKSSNEILQKSAEKLALAYANIDYTAEKALGAEKFSGAKEQLQNLTQQQLLIQEQIRNEDSKKKTDHGKIADWERQIQELGAKANAVINEIVEGIIGGSAVDIASELGDAFIDAFQSGENAAEAWGNKVNDIVADVLKRMLVSKYLEEPLGEIFNKYKSKWYKDGEFAGIDAIMESMGGFANDLNTVGSEFQMIWDTLPDNIKNMFSVDEEASSQDSTRGGFESMSQETGSELNGRFTALQISNEEIKNSMLLALGNMSALCTTTSDGNILLSEMRNLALMSNGHLEDIARYTKPILGFGEKLDKIERNTANL